VDEQIGGDRGGMAERVTGATGTASAAGPVGAAGDEHLAAVFDGRLADVWLEVFASGAGLSESMELLGCFLRMAYLRGYADGLCEAQPGSLFTSLGLPVPPRRTHSGRV
jgi:hypothetical protein